MRTKRSPASPCLDTLPLPFGAPVAETLDVPRQSKAFALEPLTVRIPVAVRLTGICRSKLYELIKAGEVEALKIGGSTLIPYTSLVRLIECARERQR